MNSNITINNYRSLRDTSPAWKLLTANNGPTILAILKTHLFDNKDERILKSSVLIERVRSDLRAISEEPGEFPRSADSYIDYWVSKNYLIREYLEGDDEERLWLSASAIDAIRFVESLANPRSSVTESRLDILMHALNKLAKDADKDVARRLESLIKERDKLNLEIEALTNGEMNVISNIEAIERVREIIILGTTLAEDFGRVQEQYQEILSKLRNNILKSTENINEVLNQVFHDIRKMDETEAGRTFQAFYSLLKDFKQRMAFQQSMEIIFGLEFFQELNQVERHFLRHFIEILFNQSLNIDKITERFSESLLSLLQSREFKERKKITALLREAQNIANELSNHINMTKALDFHIELPMSTLDSISRISPMDYYPDNIVVPITKAETPEVDLETIIKSMQTNEIDFLELKNNIISVLNIRDKATIGDILYRFPATQGIASVVGLIHLAYRHGERETKTETISWEGYDGIYRSASIDKWYFLKENLDELSA
ncbi:MAG: DUF3375 domain-containing protein [Endomicrobium sp.]|jgi:hypothetical protein|nr:DUF3375 domain-containing protein [Endomicrobium sp.]